jgi:beta-lactamase regulating signal transducer with metallopeptidase domain
MIAAWMLYSTWVGVLAAAAAALSERVCGALGRPVRFGWCAALAATVVLSGAALVRIQATDGVTDRSTAELLTKAAGSQAGVEATSHGRLRQVRAALGAAEDRMYGAIAGSAVNGRILVTLWVTTSLLLALLFGRVLLHMRRARQRWRRVQIAGGDVYAAPDAGPALVGLRRPIIVVPEWLLAAPEADQRLAVHHEREHRHARDHLLLAAVCLLVCVLPWNAAVWWMLRRTRLAVELDCDARVLRRGVRPGDYGALLLAVAARGARLPLAAPALSDTTTQLERRIIAMTQTRTNRSARPRAAAGALAAAILALAACSADMPTAAEIDRMDVTAAQSKVEAAGFLRVNDGTPDPLFIVDDVIVSRDAAHAIAPERIASIEVVKGAAAAAWGDAAAHGVVKVTTRREGDVAAEAAPVRVKTPWASAATGDGGEGTRVRVRTADGSALADPLIIIDGAEAAPDFQLGRVDPATIEAIEVLKGDAAVRAYGQRAASGAIRITLKK